MLTRVWGGWEISDYTVTLSNRMVVARCYNTYMMVGGSSFSGEKHYYPSSNSFSYYPSFSNDYMVDSSMGGVCGAVSQVSLTHGGSSWILDVSVYKKNS